MRFNLICCFWIYASICIVNAQSVLNYFNAQVLNAQVVLNWEVRIGNTCDGIEIQHSTDSISFVKIGEIAGVCGSKIENIAYQKDQLFRGYRPEHRKYAEAEWERSGGAATERKYENMRDNLRNSYGYYNRLGRV